MLLLDDDDELPEVPEEGEAILMAQLDADALRAIDEALVGQARAQWHKIARVVGYAVEARGFPTDEPTTDLFARRVVALVAAGALECQGNPRKPRWSEVRLPRVPPNQD